MNFLTKSFHNTFLSGLVLLLSFSATAQETDLEIIYGQDEKNVYLTNKVKEVYVESDEYYNGTLIRPRFVSDYYLMDSNGQMIQKKYAHNGKLTGKTKYEYNSKGVLEVSTSFVRSADASRDTTWKPSSQHRHVKAGKKAPGHYRWDTTAGKWVAEKSGRTWVKNDTTYVEERTGSSQKSKSISRFYLLGSDPTILRHDHVQFSPKGMSEPSYYYTKTENGKVVESGKMDFEMEIMAYLQQHPEASRLLFTKYGFYPVMDKIARHSPGRRVPSRTYVYTAQGQLMQEKGYITITYTRDASGRVVTRTSDEGIITNYYYNENGLLEGQVSIHDDGRPYDSKFYRYVFH
ncbi:hypothetical protein JAO76_14625 [Pontibacter sp. BT310]|uniref:Sugar-binding protein n=1 Tax=Pontibacter populi TaxID=890055 RepID=A0ABS6XEI0_9BACT|nr:MULTISPECIES: hypothetical protein [Pontibacter]MBJ6119442.1 hypothetical protein [Pontibacter sp. BT310]MBR0571870.1 hypothetical protein [Microvirga sp. STS03]MBW3366296.1 hypothetical protein [Pontibacter populi]